MDINQAGQNADASLENLLELAEQTLRSAIDLSIKNIGEGKFTDRQVFEIWARYGKGISDYFMKEAQRTNNEDLAKNVIKYIMFRKF